MWSICKQFPQYLPLAQKAARILGRMFSAKWHKNCYLCGNLVLSESEHLMLYCIHLNNFRNVLWKRLLNRFGVNFFIDFISNPPESQIDLLFSGSRELLNDEKDVKDCMKIFLMSLAKLPSYSNILI